MARHRDAQCGVAGDFRRMHLRIIAMARDKIAGSGTKEFARTDSSRARLGEGKRLQRGNRAGDATVFAAAFERKSADGQFISGGQCGSAKTNPRTIESQSSSGSTD